MNKDQAVKSQKFDNNELVLSNQNIILKIIQQDLSNNKNEQDTLIEKNDILLGIFITQQIKEKSQLELIKEETSQISLETIAHVLKTPLNNIINMMQFYMQEISVEQQISEKYLNPILASCQVLKMKINNLIDYQQLIEGKFELLFQFFQIREIIQQSIEMLSLQKNKKQINIITEIDSSIPQKIYNDPEIIEQILLNLMTNSIEHSCHGGEILISLSSDENKQIKVVITDYGHGMNETQVKSINYEDFKVKNEQEPQTINKTKQQSEQNLKSNSQSQYGSQIIINSQKINQESSPISQLSSGKRQSGLGLLIVKELAKSVSNNYPLQVISSVGKGSQFIFFITNFDQQATGRRQTIDRNTNQQKVTSFHTLSKNIISEPQEIRLRQVSSSKLSNQHFSENPISPKSQLFRFTRYPIEIQMCKNSEQQSKKIQIIKFLDVNIQKIEEEEEKKESNIEINQKEQKMQNNIIRFSIVKEESQQSKGYSELLNDNKRFSYIDDLDDEFNQNENSLSSFINQINMFNFGNSKRFCKCNQVLCVDDDEFNLLVLKTLFTKNKIKIDQCEDGQEAVDLVKKKFEQNTCCKFYKLIIMDMDMPEKNGYQASKEIISINDIYSKDRICLHSAFINAQLKKQFLEIGVSKFLEKPCDSNKFLITIKNYFENL